MIPQTSVLGAILLFDVLLIFKRPHVPSHKESVLWVSFYATLAVIFALLLGLVLGDWNRTSEFETRAIPRLIVRHEELMNDPVSVVERVCALAGLARPSESDRSR